MEDAKINLSNQLKQFYKEKRVLLTGHTGFKGTWMSALLEELGTILCGYSLPLNNYSFFKKVSPHMAMHIEGDIADSDKVLQVVEQFQPEIVFHFASHSSLDQSMEIPDFILQTNLMGAVNVLEAVRRNEGVKAVVVITSDKCYQNQETDIPYTEEAPLGAKEPYSTSKVCQELLTGCYADTFFQRDERKVGVASARASNVIGAGDYNISRLMPYLLDCFLHDRTPQIRNPYAVRPWQYVLDVLYGYLLLAEKLYCSAGITSKYNGAYNFGPGKDGFAQVGQMAEMTGKYFDNAFYVKNKEKGQISSETKILKLDSTKANKVLNWHPQKTLEETVALTVDFVKSEKNGESAAQLCRKQIRKYLEGIR